MRKPREEWPLAEIMEGVRVRHRLARRLQKVARHAKPLAQQEEFDLQPGDVIVTYADISKAKKLINYDPKTSFKKGIEKFANWHKK